MVWMGLGSSKPFTIFKKKLIDNRMKYLLHHCKTLFAVLTLLTVGPLTTQAQEEITETFDTWGASLPDGWTLLGGATYGTSYGNDFIVDADYAKSGKALYSNNSSSTSTKYIVTPKLTGKVTLDFRKKGSSSSTKGYVYIYEYDEETQTVGTTSLFTIRPNYTNEATTKYQTASFTVSGEQRLAIMIANTVIDNLKYTPATVATEGKSFAVFAEQKIANGDVVDYGLVDAGAEKTFTVKNTGTEDLTLAITVPDGFSVGSTSMTVTAAEKEATFTLAATTEATGGTVTVKAEGIDEPLTFQVKATVKDPENIFIDFADAQIPTGWYSVPLGSYASEYGKEWTAAEGYAYQQNGSSSYEFAFTSPMLRFAQGETIYFSTARYGTSSYYTPSILVEYSNDGTSWTAIGSAFTDDQYGQWTQRQVTMPEDAKYIRFRGWYVRLTNIYGGTLSAEPIMTVQADPISLGMVSADATATFTIKNEGGAELTGITAVSSNPNIALADVPALIAKGSEATVSVNLSAAVKGLQEAVVTVNAEGQAEQTVPVMGYVIDPEAILLTFDDNLSPEGWDNQGWTFADGMAVGSYTSATTSRNSEMTSPAITVAEGEALAIEAQGTGSYAELKVYTSADQGQTWTLAKDFSADVRANTSTPAVLIVSGIAAGNYKLKLEGYEVKVNTVNGFHLNENAPELSVTLGSTAITTGAKADFGKVKTQPEAKTYTIQNKGTGTLQVEISSSDAAFTVSESAMSLAAGESKTFSLNMALDTNYGPKSATITIHPANEGLADVLIEASATTVDPEQLDIDFEDGQLPERWTSDGGWSVTTDFSSDNHFLSVGRDLGTVVSQKVKGTDVSLDARRYLDSYVPTLKFYTATTADGPWTEVRSFTAEEIPGEEFVRVNFTAPEGDYFLKIEGRYVEIDNISGLKASLNDPRLSVYANAEATDEAPATVDFGFAEADATQTLTLKNTGIGTLTLAETLNAPDGFTAAIDKATLAPNEKATLTLTMPVDGNYGVHQGELTIESDGGSFTTSLKGVAIDPLKVNIDFRKDNLPEGWAANEWTISTGEGGYAHASTEGNLSSPVLVAAEGEQVVLSVQGRKDDFYQPASLQLLYSTDEGATWTAISLTDQLTSSTEWTTVVAEGLPAGLLQIAFAGDQVNIQRIYGLELPRTGMTVLQEENTVEVGQAFDFGTVQTEQTMTFGVRNDGNLPLTLTSISADNEAFAIAASEQNIIAAGATVAFSVTLKAEAGQDGTHEATVTIKAEGQDDFTFKVKGETRVPAAVMKAFDGETELNAEYTYDFGEQKAAAEHTFTVKNEGDAPLTLTEATSSDETTFTVTLPETKEIAPGESATVTVTMLSTKEHEGAHEATITLKAEGQDDFTFKVKGETKVPAAVMKAFDGETELAAEYTYDFGEQKAAAEHTFTVKNEGDAPLTLTEAISSDETAFTVTLPESKEIAPGESATVTVGLLYDEDALGDKTATVTLKAEGQDDLTFQVKAVTAADTTGIRAVRLDAAKGAIYDLRGRKQNTANLPAGIYIQNGKKIVVK